MSNRADKQNAVNAKGLGETKSVSAVTLREPDYTGCKCGRAIHPEIADVCPRFMSYHIKKAEKEQLQRTNGVAGAMFKFAEKMSKKPHKHWYLKFDKRKVTLVPEEQGLYLQQAVEKTIKTIKKGVAKELDPIIKLRSQGIWVDYWTDKDGKKHHLETGCSVIPTRELIKLRRRLSDTNLNDLKPSDSKPSRGHSKSQSEEVNV